MVERVNVRGVGVSAINMATAVETIEGWIAARSPHYVCITGVHGVMESQADPELRAIHNRAGLVTPDGMPLVWLSRLSGRRDVGRVYGPDLMLELSEISTRKIGRAHVCTPVTNAHLVCRLLLEKKKCKAEKHTYEPT